MSKIFVAVMAGVVVGLCVTVIIGGWFRLFRSYPWKMRLEYQRRRELIVASKKRFLVIPATFVFGAALFFGIQFADQKLSAKKPKPKAVAAANKELGPASEIEAPEAGPVVKKFTLKPGYVSVINIRPYIRHGLTQFACEGPPEAKVVFFRRGKVVKTMPLEEFKRYGWRGKFFDRLGFYPVGEVGEVKIVFSRPP